MYQVGIDVGGTKIEIVLLKKGSSEPVFRKRIATNAELGYSNFLKNIENLVQLVLKKTKKEKITIGIGIPGSISKSDGKTSFSNLRLLNGQNIKKDVEKILSHKIYLENDANCFALSESIMGAAKNAKLVLGIIIGTGLGSGLIFEKKIISGLHGQAGELGHITTDFSKEVCFCSQKGCYESFISGKAIESRFQKKTKKEWSLPKIYQAYLEKEKNAVFIIQEFLENFAKIISNFIMGINPDIIVLGGGVSNLPILYKEGKKAIEKILPSSFSIPEILPNQLGDSSGVFGAALIPFSQEY